MKALTYKQYRIINIFLLTVIFVFIESAVTLGANLWFRELPYVLSLAVLFVSLEMMRWDGWAVTAALVSGITFCLASGASGQQYAIYVAGNLFMLLGLFFLKAVGKDKIRDNVLLTICYAILEYVLAECGRSIISLIFGAKPLIIIQFLTTDSLSGLFAVIALLILRNIDGLFEDQRSYLLRLDEERRAGDENGEDRYLH